MKLFQVSSFPALFITSAFANLGSATSSQPTSGKCDGHNVTYKGLYDGQVDKFVGIRYAGDTGGENRFKPPVAYIPAYNSIINATIPGPACPQPGAGPITHQAPPDFNFAAVGPAAVSEDCLRLNVWRPTGTKEGDSLPVLVWIYGGEPAMLSLVQHAEPKGHWVANGCVGSFIYGYKDDLTWHPRGMLSESVANGHPIIHVELNYRLGIFGFAQSQALEAAGSENAGLRDQRLAIEWVHNNIAAFGGDPHNITIHGQSSGGLAVGMQLMAFGASRPYPFQRAICESQALEPGITGNFTRVAMAAVVDAVKCNDTSLDSSATVACLRKVSMNTLLQAQVSTSSGEPSANIGDQWLPVVDGPNGFLPAAPSTLISQKRFANATTMIGWTENDGLYFVPETDTAQETYEFVRAYLPGFTDAHIQQLLSLYPSSDFQASRFPNGTVQVSAETYRSGRILRDILFVCPEIHYGQAIAAAGNSVYLYHQNQTILDPILEFYGMYGYGPIHTSELAYVFGNLTHYHFYTAWPFHPTAADYRLTTQESRTWSTFTALGQPSLTGHDTLPGWTLAQFGDANFGIYVIGGPNPGFSSSGGSAAARKAIAAQKLQARCAFLNSPEVLPEIHY